MYDIQLHISILLRPSKAELGQTLTLATEDVNRTKIKKKKNQKRRGGNRRATCLESSRTNRLGVPSNAEVELATGAIGGRRRERDGGHVEDMRERVMMMIMMMILRMIMQLMTVIPVWPAGMRLGYVKTQKRPQAATRSADVVAVDGRGGARQVRQGGTSMQRTLIAVRQEGIRHAGNGSEEARRQARADRRVCYAELPDGVHAGTSENVLERWRRRGDRRGARLAMGRLTQIETHQRQRRSATDALHSLLLGAVLSGFDGAGC